MKLIRRELGSVTRESVWEFLDAMADSMAHPSDEGRTAAGVIAALSAWRGSRQGAVAEVGFVVLFSALKAVYALVPMPRRLKVYDFVTGHQYPVVMIGWLSWWVILGDLRQVQAVCECPGCVAVRQHRQHAHAQCVILPDDPDPKSGS